MSTQVSARSRAAFKANYTRKVAEVNQMVVEGEISKASGATKKANLTRKYAPYLSTK